LNKDLSRWCTSGSGKCKGCNTSTGANRFGTYEYVYYCFTDGKGNEWPSCERCLDKVRKMRDDSLDEVQEG